MLKEEVGIAVKIRNNLGGMNAHRNQKKNATIVEKSIKKLSTGYKINSAADDASGLAISRKMSAAIRGMDAGDHNIDQGQSVVKTADGALQEVNDMLVRLKELGLTAQNGTYTSQEREYLADEANELLTEIDRIANSTQINGVFPLNGSQTLSSIAAPPPIGFDKIQLTADLTRPPLRASGQVDLSVIAGNGSGGTNRWGLVYGEGSTSATQVRLTLADGTTKLLDLSPTGTLPSPTDPFSRMTIGTVTQTTNPDGSMSWTLPYTYADAVTGVDVTVEQTISVGTKVPTDTSQYYDISYKVINNSTTAVTADFMHHFDTAYNNQDNVERYYINGQKINHETIYAKNPTGSIDGLPDDLSIFGPTANLSFTGNVVLDTANQPDYFLVGRYASTARVWGKYDTPGSGLGSMADGTDLGYGMVWKGNNLAAGGSQSYSLKFGIKSVEHDANVPGNIEPDPIIVEESASLWIQTSATQGDGLDIDLVDARLSALGLDEFEGFDFVGQIEPFLESIDEAIKTVLTYRSGFGAALNRLEHAQSGTRNTLENLTASLSKLQDTDMAKQEMEFVKINVLMQTSQAMLAQANQSPQSVLQLLQ